jgi:hypothetical protein
MNSLCADENRFYHGISRGIALDFENLYNDDYCTSSFVNSQCQLLLQVCHEALSAENNIVIMYLSIRES